MGKTKTKIMDDSVQAEEALTKGQSSSGRKKLGRQDELVEKLKAEFENVGTSPKEPKEERAKTEPTSSPVIASEATPEAGEAKQSSLDDSSTQIATSPSAPRNDKIKKSQKQGKSKPRGKKYQEITKDLDKTQNYALIEAIELVKKGSYSKFTGTLEAHINTISTNIRGLVSLPFASGKKLTILAFGKGAEGSGADIIGSEEIIENINKGKLGFDLVITTPEWMPKLAKVARILGPRGLMPNPKNGTITSPSADGLKKAVQGFQGGKTEYKTEAKAPVIHLSLGKLDQPTEELSANIKTLLQILGKTRVKKVTLSPTMGPSVKLDLSSL